ncbi:hypothetical protein SEVIR_3G180566v4 [Setaria viridis]
MISPAKARERPSRSGGEWRPHAGLLERAEPAGAPPGIRRDLSRAPCHREGASARHPRAAAPAGCPVMWPHEAVRPRHPPDPVQDATRTHGTASGRGSVPALLIS